MSEEKHKEGHGEEHGGGGHGGGHGGGDHGGGGHGDGEHEGAPEWLISFADNVALMMGFFVILLAMNMKAPVAKGGIGSEEDSTGTSAGDRLDFIIALRQAFNPIDMNSNNAAEAPMRKRIRERLGQNLLSRQPEEHGEAKESQAQRPTNFSNLGGDVSFDDNAETLTDAATKRAREIAERIRGQRYYVDIRGHASSTETYRNPEKAMALSYARASAVARVLTANGVSWDQVRMVACGTGQPVIDKSYDDDHINQRVEVVVTSEKLPEPGGAAGPGPSAVQGSSPRDDRH